ncbi:MAG TPA: hypothetical protein DD637_03000 [Verrucomicrobia bacterium]|nr:hypothetical protein [Verrucomicrobiota bacterium]
MIAEDCNAAWERLMGIVIDAGASDEFLHAAEKAAEAAGRAIAATYENERVHALMCARQEFYYELADRIRGAQETSETRAKVEEAERIRRELEST